MKKIFVLFSFIFISPVFADVVSDFSNMCGDVGYDRIYAKFSPLSITCENGYFLPVNSLTCAPCPTGFTCPGGTFVFSATDAQGLSLGNSRITASVLNNACVPHIATRRMYAVFTMGTYTCESGYFLPAASTTCAPCPTGFTCSGGTFGRDDINAQGIVKNSQYLSSSANNACASNTTVRRVYANFLAPTFTCASGYFLPANSFQCTQCPTGYTCSGGTFSHNKTEAQGIVRNENEEYLSMSANNTCANNIKNHVLNGIFEPNVHDCAPGYYMPANYDGCQPCLRNNKCVGGTYTFNETTTQGIELCDTGLVSPMGSSVCYPHILHIGDEVVYLKSTKLTIPSLNVGWDGDVFYANMTTTPTNMSFESEHYLKLNINGTLYYVCDDSTYGR